MTDPLLHRKTAALPYRCRCSGCGWVGYRKPAWRIDVAVRTIYGPEFRVHINPCPKCNEHTVHGLSPKGGAMSEIVFWYCPDCGAEGHERGNPTDYEVLRLIGIDHRAAQLGHACVGMRIRVSTDKRDLDASPACGEPGHVMCWKCTHA